uniref:Uncharacterized protein n=1 Tax=Daphnia magna TaxID=35525 RepID=A0A0P6H704_9CRUS
MTAGMETSALAIGALTFAIIRALTDKVPTPPTIPRSHPTTCAMKCDDGSSGTRSKWGSTDGDLTLSSIFCHPPWRISFTICSSAPDGLAVETKCLPVGEYVGGGAELDNWCNSVQNRAGTFDFGLRGSIYGMVTGNGFFDMGSIPGSQQGNRLRTVPFVNNHDTFRPKLTAEGNYNGWDSSQELAAHIDPYDGRLSAAYAIAFAVDGTPTVFIEDLFDLGQLGNRFTHDPKSAAQLPVRSDIANIIWCHQHLRFKEGAYKVPYSSGDLLVIERSAKAIIGITDSWTVWQTATVATDFPAGTVLKDHSGATVETATVGGDRKVTIKVPPCNGEALGGRRCYAIWGPLTPPGYTPAQRETTQEWEMADDLGDSHPLSLQQGGKLPANSIETRTVGRIFVAASSPVTFYLFLSDSLNPVTVELYNENALVHSESPSTQGSYTPNFTGWYSIHGFLFRDV